LLFHGFEVLQLVNRSNFLRRGSLPKEDVPITTQQSKPQAIRRTGNPNFLRWARQTHLLLGTFFAPAIVFFALTGALQTFSLHESRPGSDYKPPVWLEKMAQLHKKQNLQLRRPGPQPARRPERVPPRLPEQGSSNIPLKCFVGIMSLGLTVVSVLGVYMAFKFGRDKRLIWGLLVCGTVLPIFLIVV
jgi:hypothetical protein